MSISHSINYLNYIFQIVRKRSPRNSLALDRQSFRQTPDSVRNSFVQLTAGAQAQNGTPPLERDGDMFR